MRDCLNNPRRQPSNRRARATADLVEAQDAVAALSSLTGFNTPHQRFPTTRRGSDPSLVSGTAAVRGRSCAGDPPRYEDGAVVVEDLEALRREAAMVVSAMEAAVEQRLPRLTPMERRLRRRVSRVGLRVCAQLKLWADGEDAEPWRLFTRDMDVRAMGFICQDRLPLGYGGTLSFRDAAGRRQELEVTVTRCRECSSGWYEGALHFSRPQAWLVDEFRQLQPKPLQQPFAHETGAVC